MEKVTALELENKSLKDVIEHLQAEKLAIDQLYTAAIREGLAVRTHAIKLEAELAKFKNDFASEPQIPHLVTEEETKEASVA